MHPLEAFSAQMDEFVEQKKEEEKRSGEYKAPPPE